MTQVKVCFLHENHAALAKCPREPGCSGASSSSNLHYTTLTCYPSLPGHINSMGSMHQQGLRILKKEETSRMWITSEKWRREGGTLWALGETLILCVIHTGNFRALCRFNLCDAHIFLLCLLFQILHLILPLTWEFLVLDFKAMVLKRAALA